MDLLITALVGLIAGGIVNVLADDLPFRRNPGIPTYPDGTPRPVVAWLGLFAFLLGKREPDTPQPDEFRSRPYYDEEGTIVDTPTRLSWRYPLTEIMTIGFMLLTTSTVQNMEGMTLLQHVFYLVYMAIFSLIIVIDMEHRLILRIVIFPSIVLALLDAIFLDQVGPNWRDALAGAGFGFGVFFVFYLGGYAFNAIVARLQNRQLPTAFGYGDVMMITLTGVLLGLASTFMALFITIFLGAFGALVYLIARRLLAGGYNAFAAIPYGPYIVIATLILLLYPDAVLSAGWAML